MSAVAVRDTRLVTETQWERLYRLVERRRRIVGLTQDGVQAVGGPSSRWIQQLRGREGMPTDRMRTPLQKLDTALHWPTGTSWSLVADDRSGWSAILLEDEEEALMESVDEVDQFLIVVGSRLRAIKQGADRDDAMRKVLAVLGVRP